MIKPPRVNVIPAVLQFASDLSSWTVGILVITLSDNKGGALFHLGYCEEQGLTFDCFFFCAISPTEIQLNLYRASSVKPVSIRSLPIRIHISIHNLLTILPKVVI